MKIENNVFCPQCGPDVPVDEDGCCNLCGSSATGDAVSRLASRLAKLEAVVEAAAYMDAAFDVMVSVRTEPKRLENARDVFAEKRREFRAAIAVLDKEPTNG